MIVDIIVGGVVRCMKDYQYLPAVEGATEAEDLFVQLFAETFGLERVQYLVNEYPFQDIYGENRYIDYALHTGLERYAIEIDGETWHNPALVGLDK